MRQLTTSNHTASFIPPLYFPTNYVYAAHGLPPQGSISYPLYDYAKGQLIFPVIFLGVGILSVIVFQSILCCRFCARYCCPQRCMKCYNKFDSTESDINERLKYHRKSRLAFFAFVMIAIAVSSFIFLVNQDITTSITTFNNSLTSLLNIFMTLEADSQNIANSCYQLTRDSELSPCNYAFEYFGIQKEFIQYANTTASYILVIRQDSSIIPTDIQSFQTLTSTIIPQKDIFFYCYFASIVGFVILLCIAYFARSKHLLSAVIVLTEILVVLFTIAAAVQILLVHLGSDYCFDPSRSTLTLLNGLNAPTLSVEVASYYTTCSGNPPFQNSYNSAIHYFTLLNSTIDTYYSELELYLNTFHQNTTCLQNIKSQINNVNRDLINILDQIACEPIWNVWNQGIQQAACTSGFTGLFGVWMCTLFTGGALYFALVSASFFYEMFSPTHKDWESDKELPTLAVLTSLTKDDIDKEIELGIHNTISEVDLGAYQNVEMHYDDVYESHSRKLFTLESIASNVGDLEAYSQYSQVHTSSPNGSPTRLSPIRRSQISYSESESASQPDSDSGGNAGASPSWGPAVHTHDEGDPAAIMQSIAAVMGSLTAMRSVLKEPSSRPQSKIAIIESPSSLHQAKAVPGAHPSNNFISPAQKQPDI